MLSMADVYCWMYTAMSSRVERLQVPRIRFFPGGRGRGGGSSGYNREEPRHEAARWFRGYCMGGPVCISSLPAIRQKLRDEHLEGGGTRVCTLYTRPTSGPYARDKEFKMREIPGVSPI